MCFAVCIRVTPPPALDLGLWHAFPKGQSSHHCFSGKVSLLLLPDSCHYTLLEETLLPNRPPEQIMLSETFLRCSCEGDKYIA